MPQSARLSAGGGGQCPNAFVSNFVGASLSGGIRAPKQRYFVQGTGYPKGLGAGKYPSLQEPMCNVAIRITSTLALIKC